jgi:hypothetical protein
MAAIWNVDGLTPGGGPQIINPSAAGQPSSALWQSPTTPPTSAAASDPSVPAFQAPTMPTSLQQPFQLPTQQDLTSMPGYAARYQQGLDALQRSAAAGGSLLSGGTLKAAQQYGQDYATNAYQQMVQNALAQRQQQSGDYWNQYGNLYNTYQGAIANNRNAMNDYNQLLLGEQQLGIQAAGQPPTSAISNV